MKDKINSLILQLTAEIAKEGDSGLCFVAPEFLTEVINILEECDYKITQLEKRVKNFEADY